MSEAIEQIKQFLSLLDSHMRIQRDEPFPSGYFSPAGMILALGREMKESNEMPPMCGKMKECYSNAQQLVMVYPDEYRYAEGWAIRGKLPFATLHAWCLNKRGMVVDPTWCGPPKSHYFGVEIDRKYMTKRAFKTSIHHAMIDDWEYGYKLLTTPGLVKKVIKSRRRGKQP